VEIKKGFVGSSFFFFSYFFSILKTIIIMITDRKERAVY